MKRVSFRTILMYGLILFLTDCSPANTSITPIPITSPPQRTNQTTPSVTSSTTPFKLETLTPSISPTGIHFPILSPIPTLFNDRAKATMLHWLEGSSDCLFPCWAGITPQLSSWQFAKQTLEPVVDFEIDSENVVCNFGLCNDLQWKSRDDVDLHGSIVSQSNNSIYRITFEGYPPSPILRLDSILQKYGKPSQVLLEGPGGPDVPWNIILAYPNHQFIIKYTWNVSYSGEGYPDWKIVGCIQNGLVEISIRIINEPWSDDLIKHEIYGNQDMTSINIKAIDEVSNLNIDSFFEKFKTIVDGNECITSPWKVWQQ